MNLTSTAMGSNATYQCRDGSSDVYTTQCTSDGVWEPNPNSTLDCTTQGIMLPSGPVTRTCNYSLSLFPCAYSEYNCHCITHWYDSGNHCHSDCSDPSGQLLYLEKKKT